MMIGTANIAWVVGKAVVSATSLGCSYDNDCAESRDDGAGQNRRGDESNTLRLAQNNKGLPFGNPLFNLAEA